MSALPPFQRLSVEDFSDQSKWIGKLLSPLNFFVQQVVLSLNNGLTVGQNINAQVKTLTLDLNNPSPYPFSFASTLKGSPAWVECVRAQDTSSNPVQLTAALGCDWSALQGSKIQINNVFGLTTGRKWQLTFVCYAG